MRRILPTRRRGTRRRRRPVRWDSCCTHRTCGARTAQAHPDALLVLQDSLITMHRQHIVEFVTQQHLPSVFSTREWVVTGGLMSYGPSFPDLNRRAATYVDKILKGAKPADLPVEQPTKFELVVNLKTAKALGLTIPPTLLFQADEVIR